MAASPTILPPLARHWWTAGIPGKISGGPYAPVEVAQLPHAPDGLGEDLEWLRALPDSGGGLAGDPAVVKREPSAANLAAVTDGWGLTIPASFATFIGDPVLQAKLGSSTMCYLDLADYVTPCKDGGRMIHFLADQQDTFHWMLYLAPDGGHAVVISPIPFGYLPDSGKLPEGALDILAEGLPVVVCAASFLEFLWRWRMENEIWAAANGLRKSAPELTAEEQAYVDAYPTTEATWG